MSTLRGTVVRRVGLIWLIDGVRDVDYCTTDRGKEKHSILD